MKAIEFMNGDFLLDTETARRLYHDAAAAEPIFDYHCHLPPAEIAENKRFSTITDIWLGGDHYKWRAMRAMGFDESYITGGAPAYDKFCAWAATVEELIGSPLYHWSHLELRRYFGIDEPLGAKNARQVWEKANAALPGLPVSAIFERFNVYAVGTTDDPLDTLEHHAAIAAGRAPIGAIRTKVLPSFRPDKALGIDKPGFGDYMAKLGALSGVPMRTVEDAAAALEGRVDFFAAHGCRAGDHALDEPPRAGADDAGLDAAFRAALAGEIPAKEAADAYKTRLLAALARMYAKHDMAMQLHFAALRAVNTRMLAVAGPDSGFDAIHDRHLSANLAGLLNLLERGALPKTILYSLNPADYYPLASIMGGFQDSGAGAGRRGVKGKMQLGSAWWFCDHKNGMEQQLRALADLGLLSSFVGMLTDSRSFLSYPRHEYFRRILCALIGRWVENGEFPQDMPLLSRIVRDICFGNAERYFAAA